MNQSDSTKIDIFDILEKLKNKDNNYFESLDDAELKKIPWLLIMKWLSGTKSKNQIILLNDLVNSNIFKFYQHPDLIRMLCQISSISKTRSTWIKRPKKEKHSIKLNVIKDYYDCTLNEAIKYLPLLENDDIISMAELIGTEKETFDKLKKELNGK